VSTPSYYLNHVGVVCPLGASLHEVRDRMFAGHSGVVESARYSPAHAIPLGLVDADLPSLDDWPVAFRSRNNALTIAAARQIAPAVAAAVEKYGAHRVAITIGASTSGIRETEIAIPTRLERGTWPDGFHLAQQELSSPAQLLARAFGVTGPAHVVSTACASSAKAMASAARLMAMNLVDAVVTGGVDTLCRFTLAGFTSLDLLSGRRCNPMSANRDGINLGEAAALFLMTREPATVSLRGWGESSDGYHITAPDPAGTGARAAIELALARAGETAAAIDYINLHGTGSHQNDLMEGTVVSTLFGDRTPVSSTKPLTGHALGAAGAIEAAVCWLAMQDENRCGYLPPHLWDEIRDPELSPLRLVTLGESFGHPPRRVLSSSFAFGGANAVLLLGRD
jgi:3-oxoacyl-[acyl-carrier-protein] synthase I